MALNPQFTSTPRATVSRISAANTARDGSGTIGTTLISSFVAGTSGSRLDFITFTSATAVVGTPSLKVARVFLTDTTGANPRLISEVAMAATASSNTAIGATATITFTNGLVIGSGQIVYTAISVYGASNVDQTDVLARGGDY